MVALSKFDGNACVHHVFAAAERTADTEHGVFIRAVVRTDSSCIGSFIVTVACGKVPLVIRIKIKRMESGKCSSACADSVDTVAHSVNAIPQLGDISRIGAYLFVQRDQVLTCRVFGFDVVTVFFNSRFLVNGAARDNALIVFRDLTVRIDLQLVVDASVRVFIARVYGHGVTVHDGISRIACHIAYYIGKVYIIGRVVTSCKFNCLGCRVILAAGRVRVGIYRALNSIQVHAARDFIPRRIFNGKVQLGSIKGKSLVTFLQRRIFYAVGDILCCRFQLAQIDGIGIFRRISYIDNLAEFIFCADRDRGGGFSVQVNITEYAFFLFCKPCTICYGTAAESYAACDGGVGVMSDDGGVLDLGFRAFIRIRRTENDASVRSRQFSLIAEENGAGCVFDFIVRADHRDMGDISALFLKPSTRL